MFAEIFDRLAKAYSGRQRADIAQVETSRPQQRQSEAAQIALFASDLNLI